jgi:hypothetical protein
MIRKGKKARESTQWGEGALLILQVVSESNNKNVYDSIESREGFLPGNLHF